MSAGKIWALLGTAIFLLNVSGAEAKPPMGARGNELPMKVYSGYLIVIEGRIGEQQGLKFLLDTGATNTAIDRKLADRLKLARRPGRLINFDKEVSVEWSEVPELAYGPEQFSDLPVIVQDMQYFLAMGIHVDAVIGWNLLKEGSFQLDFARKRVVFGQMGSFEGRAVPMRPQALFLTVQVEIDGRSVPMIADTGMLGATFYEGSLTEMRERNVAGSRTVGTSVGGAVKFRNVLVPKLRLGDQELDREVYLVQRPPSESLRGVAGYLGISSLEAKEVAFDFERNELKWRNK